MYKMNKDEKVEDIFNFYILKLYNFIKFRKQKELEEHPKMKKIKK